MLLDFRKEELSNQDENVNYAICVEYEDELGNDCTTNTIAAGKEKIRIVKIIFT
jgi:hypothetical protein